MREEHFAQQQKLVPVRTMTVYCDSCGKGISYDEHYDDTTAHEILIQLDGEECVNFFRRRDYCDPCNVHVWTEINKLIDAEPWVERDRDYG